MASEDKELTVDTPKVERGRDGKYRKPDGFQMIDIAIDESEEHLDEVEKKWDTLENIDRKSGQQRKKQRRAAGVATAGGSLAVGAAVGSGSSAKGVGRELGNVGRSARGVVRHAKYVARVRPSDSLPQLGRSATTFGRTVAHNPVGAAVGAGGALAAGGAAKFGYHKGRENKLNATALKRRNSNRRAIGKSAFEISKDNPTSADTHLNRAMKMAKPAVATAPKLVKPVVQGKMQQVKTTFGKASTPEIKQRRAQGYVQQRRGGAQMAAGVAGGAAIGLLHGPRIANAAGATKSAFGAGRSLSRSLGVGRLSSIGNGAKTAGTMLTRRKGAVAAAGGLGASAGLYGAGAKNHVQGQFKVNSANQDARRRTSVGKGIGDDKAPRRPGQWSGTGRSAAFGPFGAASAAKGGKKLRTGLLAAGRGTAESTAGSLAGTAVGVATKSPVLGHFGSSAGSLAGGIHGSVSSVKNSRKKGYLRRGF